MKIYNMAMYGIIITQGSRSMFREGLSIYVCFKFASECWSECINVRKLNQNQFLCFTETFLCAHLSTFAVMYDILTTSEILSFCKLCRNIHWLVMNTATSGNSGIACSFLLFSKCHSDNVIIHWYNLTSTNFAQNQITYITYNVILQVCSGM